VAHRASGILLAAVVGLGTIAASAPAAHASVKKPLKVTTVVVQGGTTPTDSGLLQAVIEPGFEAAYPQYRLKYVSVGTAQAILNAENGQGDAVFTHSVTAENTFVTSGYSYEPGGRLVMSSDFITVGAKSDPAGVLDGPAHDAVAAFEEIATAGANGDADFVSRGDGSGTNAKELSIWALSNVPRNTLGEPGTPGTTTDAPWYHKTGVGQGQNLSITDQCPFSSGACYTIADRGTFAAQVASGAITNLKQVSQDNNGPNALGGASLLINPYHVYAVNPQKEPGVHINLAGALAFLKYLTNPKTQKAIGDYPNAANPAFFPDARPDVAVTQGVPKNATATDSVTVKGTDVPNYYLDPPNTGAPVLLIRSGDPGTTIAQTTVASDGTFSLTFTPTVTDNYTVYFPQYADGLVLPSNTAYRQSTTAIAGVMHVKAVVTLSVDSHSGLDVDVSGTAAPATNRNAANVRIQAKESGTWVNVGGAIPMPNGQSTYSTTVTLPNAGRFPLRAQYTDSGVVTQGVSHAVSVKVP
jgi:tungstate transport system substrate-binding protein